MKSGRKTSTNKLSPKGPKYFYANYHLALQLYQIYKIESLPQKDPRLPLKDPRRPVIKRHQKLVSKTTGHFFNTEFLAFKKAFEWFSSPIELYLHKLSK